MTTSRAASPIHELKWDPYTVNEFASVGQNGTVLFWLLDETTTDVCLNVHEAEVPDELLQGHHKVSHFIFISLLTFAMVSMNRNKDCLAYSQNNVFEWSGLSICGLFCDLALE